MGSNIVVSVATILHNDFDALQPYIEETVETLSSRYPNYELVLIDNGSTDHSAALVKLIQSSVTNIRLISLSRHYDHEHARTAALDHCIGDFIILMDINYDPPALIPDMVNKALEGYDLIIGEVANRHDHGLQNRITSKLFYKLSHMMTGYKINPNESDYVLFSRKMVNSLVQIRDRSRYLKFLKLEVGFKRSAVQYDRIRRCEPKRKRNFFSNMGFALEMIITNSEKLLRLVSLVGFTTSFLNILYVLYVLLVVLFKKDVAEGWTTTSLFNSTMFGLLFMILSIIGIYISAILKETKKGPLYYVTDESNSSVIYKNIYKKNVV